MEAMNLVEVVLHNEHEDRDGDNADINETQDGKQNLSNNSSLGLTSLLDSSVTITVTRTSKAAIKEAQERKTGKPASFALMSPIKNGTTSGRAIRREELVCKGCERVFKYKAAFLRHEAQCGHPAVPKPDRNILEEQKAIKAAEIQRRKEEEKLPELRCPSCLKQFHDNISFNSHDFESCAAERATYTFVCNVCKARFKYKNHLRRHEDSHNNVRRYECDVCTTAFLRPDHLKRHMMRMHGIVRMPTQNASAKCKKKRSPGAQEVRSSQERVARKTTKNAPMQCPMCSKVLSRRDHVLRHMRNVHHLSYSGSRTLAQKSVSGEMAIHTNTVLTGYEDLAEDQAEYDMDGDMDGSMEAEGEDDGSEYLSMSEEQMTGEEDEASQHSVGRKSVDSKVAIKKECMSPSEETQGFMCSEERDPNDNDQIAVTQESHCSTPAENDAMDQQDSCCNNSMIKKEPPSPERGDMNGNGDTKDNEIENHRSLAAPENTAQVSKTFSTPISSFDVISKPGLKSASDGNQNVVSNGLVPGAAGGAGEDWISDLVNSGLNSGW